MADGSCVAPTKRLAGVRLVTDGALRGKPETVVVAEWILRGGRAVLTKGRGMMGADMIEETGYVLSGRGLAVANLIARELGIPLVDEGTYLPDSGIPFLLGLLEDNVHGDSVWAEAIMSA